MKVIRLEQQLIEEVVEYLKIQGTYKSGMSAVGVIRAALSTLLYQTPVLQDGRDQAAEILAKAGHAPLSTVRGRVAKFAQTYDWQRGQDIHVPEKVRKTIEKANVTVEEGLLLEVQECSVREVSSLSDASEVFPDKPPWTLMKLIPFEEVLLVHPLHPLVKWCEGDELKIRAVECAFGNIPQALHKDQKIIEMANKLYKYFTRWKKDSELQK